MPIEQHMCWVAVCPTCGNWVKLKRKQKRLREFINRRTACRIPNLEVAIQAMCNMCRVMPDEGQMTIHTERRDA